VAAEPEANKFVPDLTAEECQHPAACLIELTVRSMLQRMEQYDLRGDSGGGKKASARKRARDDAVPVTPEALVKAAPLSTAEAREAAAKKRRPTKIAAVEVVTAKPGSRLVLESPEEISPEEPSVESHLPYMEGLEEPSVESQLQKLLGMDIEKALDDVVESFEAQEEANQEEPPEARMCKDDYFWLSAVSPEGPAEVEEIGCNVAMDLDALLDGPDDLGPFHLRVL
jgi:hypothetical protein